MNYCKIALTKGSPYQVYRNGVLVNSYSGLIESITETNCLHIGFFGDADIKPGDTLENSEHQFYYVLYTALESVYKPNDKRIVICECGTARQEKLSEKNFSHFHEIINTIIGILALLIALFKE